jgi:hypothetical protein
MTRALKGQLKSEQQATDLPFQGARCYFRYLATGAMPAV